MSSPASPAATNRSTGAVAPRSRRPRESLSPSSRAISTDSAGSPSFSTTIRSRTAWPIPGARSGARRVAERDGPPPVPLSDRPSVGAPTEDSVRSPDAVSSVSRPDPLSAASSDRLRSEPRALDEAVSDGSPVESPEAVDWSEVVVSPDSVDYAADLFKYTDGGAVEDLTVYYVAATQAQLKLKKVAPGGSNSETLVEHDTALTNRRDPNRDGLTFQFNQSPLQGTIPKDWRLEWTIDGPYGAGYDPDADPVPVNFLVSVPINRAQVAEVEGLGSAVGDDTSDRV